MDEVSGFLLEIAPYLFAYLSIFILGFTQLVIRHLVVPHEPLEGVREKLGSYCGFTVAVVGLLSFSLAACVTSLFKIAVAISTTSVNSYFLLFIGAFLAYVFFWFFVARYVGALIPDQYLTRRGGVWGLTVAQTLDWCQVCGVSIGLIVDTVLYVLKPRH